MSLKQLKSSQKLEAAPFIIKRAIKGKKKKSLDRRKPKRDFKKYFSLAEKLTKAGKVFV